MASAAGRPLRLEAPLGGCLVPECVPDEPEWALAAAAAAAAVAMAATSDVLELGLEGDRLDGDDGDELADEPLEVVALVLASLWLVLPPLLLVLLPVPVVVLLPLLLLLLVLVSVPVLDAYNWLSSAPDVCVLAWSHRHQWHRQHRPQRRLMRRASSRMWCVYTWWNSLRKFSFKNPYKIGFEQADEQPIRWQMANTMRNN